MTTKLTDAQRLMLSAAAQREDRFSCAAAKPKGRRRAEVAPS